MESKKIKMTAILAVKVIGILLVCAIAVLTLIAFMWACHFAGIPM